MWSREESRCSLPWDLHDLIITTLHIPFCMDHYNLFSDIHAKIHTNLGGIWGAWEARNEVVDAQYNFEGLKLL